MKQYKSKIPIFIHGDLLLPKGIIFESACSVEDYSYGITYDNPEGDGKIKTGGFNRKIIENNPKLFKEIKQRRTYDTGRVD